MRQFQAAGLCVGAVLLSSCAHPAGSYRLVTGGVLVPPGIKDASVERTTLRAAVPAGKHSCEASPSGMRIDGKRVIVSREALAKATSDELNAWTAALEKNGCIGAAEAFTFKARVVDALPLSLAARHALRGEGLAVQGFLDLTDGNSLRVVSPVFRSGTAAGASAVASDVGKVSAGASGGLTVDLKANPDLAGYEIAWYDVQARTDGAGFRIVPRRAETYIAGEVQQNPLPRLNQFMFEAGARCFRFFLLTRSSANDYDIVVLSARTPEEMEERTSAFRKSASEYLKSAARDSYAAMSREMGVNPYVRVKVNGSVVDVEPGQTVRQAVSAKAPGSVAVSKPAAGRLYPVTWVSGTQTIVDLPLEGGEEIVAGR